jgi:hypothetical protein
VFDALTANKKIINGFQILSPKSYGKELNRKHLEDMIELILYKRYQNLQRSNLNGVWGVPG